MKTTIKNMIPEPDGVVTLADCPEFLHFKNKFDIHFFRVGGTSYKLTNTGAYSIGIDASAVEVSAPIGDHPMPEPKRRVITNTNEYEVGMVTRWKNHTFIIESAGFLVDIYSKSDGSVEMRNLGIDPDEEFKPETLIGQISPDDIVDGKVVRIELGVEL